MFALKTFLTLFVFAFAANVQAQYAQLSSLVNQKNGVIGKGVALTFNSIDAISSTGIAFTKGGSVITIKTAGTYFVIASPQVGFLTSSTCASATTYTADYWLVLNGKKLDNSNVRLTAVKTHVDVIPSQGVSTFVAGDKLQLFGSGTCSQSVAIGVTGEAFIPSIIFSIYKI